ncbi:uncharacterized protein EV154DRAFT_437146 [Mucor mucedo]|uniref:uncharacterized protein n=1 Tax=Mucor mucedo TaxID=29922 RepID=UPI00221E6372|nr:uncharacterized protein EV154DRAFT_437146 [Mucor mucedo]KAI7895251.1 hypothetical protein EV154DRAFT_437146 [Mucor mucedo]
MAVIEEIVEEPIVEIPQAEAPKEVVDLPKPVPHPDQDGDIFFETEEYPAEELKELIRQSMEYKAKGNAFFGQGEYKKAIDEYENALMTCPESVYKERAIYFGNIAACHLKQNELKEARDMCSQALILDPKYTKALLRRAQANEKIGTSTAMTESLEDFKKLKQSTSDAYTLRECRRAENELPKKIKEKMEAEKEEMMGKLKDLGNTLLGKFGLSTDNFQLQQDPAGSGGYSMNFVNSPSK